MNENWLSAMPHGEDTLQALQAILVLFSPFTPPLLPGGSAAPGAGPNQVASPVGIVGVNLPEPTDAAIWGMWVAPESRRRGLAAELLHNAEAWAAKSGADTATLWVHRSNIEAQALHHSRGYKLVEPDDLPADVPDACCAEVCMRARLAST